MCDFHVRFGPDASLQFASPVAVLRASDARDVRQALRDAERALDDGYWIAGYVGYDGGVPLALGVFTAPSPAPAPSGELLRVSPLCPSTDRDAYDAAVERIANAIYEGDVYQVNFTVPFAFSFVGDPLTAYGPLAAAGGAAYCAYVRDGSRALLSLSPELFLEFDEMRVVTKPMKGTAKPAHARELDNDKNRAEHVMIVDLLRNDLHRVCDDVRVDRLFAREAYPTFVTMTSTISGRLRTDATLPDVWQAAFPCGSVTGAPKRAAMQMIERLERMPRQAYCGSIGFLSPQRRGWWNVAIRTAQFDCATGLGRYDAGGGIVSDSIATHEWDELYLKTEAFRGVVAPFDIRETFASGDAAVRHLHLERLRASASRLAVPFDAERVHRELDGVDMRPGCLVQLRLHHDGSIEARNSPLERTPEPVAVCLAEARVRSDDPMLAHKTSWRPSHDRAASQARALGCFDALLRNEHGQITEGARTTIFAQFDGALVTPPLRCGLLPGILRSRIVSEGRASEQFLTADCLRRAEAIYVGNSARGLLRARLIGSHE